MSNRQIKIGALISYVAIFINITAGLIYTPWMIKQIGRADYGLYILITSVMTYFVVDYGLSQSITRLLAKYKSEGNFSSIDNILGITAKLYLTLDLIVIIALIIFYFFIDDVFIELTPNEIVKFKQIYVIAAFFSILSFPLLFVGGIYYAFSLFSQVKVFDLVSKLVSVFLTFLLLSMGYGLLVLVLVNAIFPFLINISKIIYLKRKGYFKINWKFWDKTTFKEILNNSGWLLIILIGELLLKNISPIIIGTFSGTREIAIFSIANTLDNYILVFASALNGLFLPKISLYLNQNNKEQLIGDLMIKVGRFQVLLVGFITLALILVGKDFIYLWVGDHFKLSYYLTVLLIIPTFLYSILQIGTTYMFALNRLKYLAFIYVLAAIFNVVFAILLTPKYGAIGSGISILICKLIFYVIGITYVFHKILKINMINFYKSTFRNLFFPLSIIFILFITFDYFTIPYLNIFTFAINCIVLSIVFAVFTYSFYLNQSETEMIRSYFRKITKRK